MSVLYVFTMPINQHGFLGTEIETVRARIRGAYSAYFDMCRETNDFAYKELLDLQVPANDGPRVAAAALTVKVLNDCQAAVILLEHGLVLQAEETLRPAIEACFHLVLLCRDPSYFEAYAAADEFDVKRAMFGATELAFSQIFQLKEPSMIAALDQRMTRLIEGGATFSSEQKA